MPARLQTVWDAVGDPLIVVDSEQRIVVFNRAAEEVFGYGTGEVLGEALGILLPERFRDEHRHQAEQFRSKGHGTRASGRPTVFGRRKNGQEFPAEVTLFTLEIEDQVVAAATVRDVSARVAAERALAESERRFRIAFEDSAVALALVDADLRFMDGNDALSALTGLALSEMRGKKMADLVDVKNGSELTEGLLGVLSGSSQIVRMELHMDDPKGQERVLDLIIAPVTDGDGRPDYLITQAVDITERVETQAQLEGLLRSKDELIASISHELRTPLTAVLGFARLLEEKSELTPGEINEMIHSIVTESTDLSNLVDDLLVAARAETGALSVVQTSLDLYEEASRVVGSVRHRETGHVRLAGSTVGASGDPARIRQILRNLVTNAIRYGGEQVSVRVSGDSRYARVSVADTGERIPPVDQERIFERYERAHRVAGVTASIGLGLAIARDLAGLMGGRLVYRFEGGENVFELILPRGGEV